MIRRQKKSFEIGIILYDIRISFTGAIPQTITKLIK